MIEIINLKDYDLHIHSFSHCVFCKRDEVSWDEIMPEYTVRIAYIKNSLKGIVEESLKKGLKIIALSEHPQFSHYNIDYSDYKLLLEDIRNEYPELKILSGIEFNVINGMGIILEEFPIGSHNTLKSLSQLQFITLGIHQGIRKNEDFIWKKFRNKNEYFNTVMEAVSSIREYYDGPVILAHPWRSAALGMDVTGDSFGGYFSKQELTEIASTLIDQRVIPEFNGSSININKSDLFFENGSILLSYLEECEKRGIKPVISLGSDGHDFNTIGNTYWEKVDKKLGLKGRVEIWCDNLSEN